MYTMYTYISFPSPSPWRFSGTKRENKLAKRANAGRPFFVINYGCRSGNILVYIQRPRRKTAASARQKTNRVRGRVRLVENSPCRPLNYAGHTSNVLVAVDIHCLLFSTSSVSSFPWIFFLCLSLSFLAFSFLLADFYSSTARVFFSRRDSSLLFFFFYN